MAASEDVCYLWREDFKRVMGIKREGRRQVMKCMVEGCPEEAMKVLGKNDEIHLCESHRDAWGYYRAGFYRSRGFVCDGQLHMKVWREAMKEFLEFCCKEIAGRNQLIEGTLRG